MYCFSLLYNCDNICTLLYAVLQAKNRPLPPTPPRELRSALLQRGNSVQIVNDIADNAPASKAEECSALTAKYNEVKDATELTFMKQQAELSSKIPGNSTVAQQNIKRIIAMNRGVSSFVSTNVCIYTIHLSHLPQCIEQKAVGSFSICGTSLQYSSDSNNL
jgi:hypothetical protein